MVKRTIKILRFVFYTPALAGVVFVATKIVDKAFLR